MQPRYARHGLRVSGVVELFRGERAAIAPATSSVAELLAILAGTRALHVTVLSGPAAAARVAEIEAAQPRHNGQHAVVVPTAPPVQALAEIAVQDARGVDRGIPTENLPTDTSSSGSPPSAWRYSTDTESTTTVDAGIAGHVSYSSSGMAAS